MTASVHRIYLQALAQRFRQSPEQIVEMALQGKLRLWLEFNNVLIQRPAPKKGKRRAAKPPPPFPVETIELQLSTQALDQLHGRCDRMLVAAELSCLDPDGKVVTVSNMLGEEWGEVSMLGLKPQDLYALEDEVRQLDAASGAGPGAEPASPAGLAPAEASLPGPAETRTVPPTAANNPDHPCFAPELEAALRCWQALSAPVTPGTTAPDKVAMLAWLKSQYPELSKTAMERIAVLISPRSSRPPAAKRRKEKYA